MEQPLSVALISAVSAAIVAVLTVLLTKGGPILKWIWEHRRKESQYEKDVAQRKEELIEKLRVDGYEKVITLMDEQVTKLETKVDSQDKQIATLRADHQKCMEESAGLRVEIAELRVDLKKRATTAVAHITANKEGDIIEWNASAEIILGWLKREIVGQKISVIIPPELKGEHHTKFKEAVLRQRSSAQFLNAEALHKNGHRIPVTIIISSGMVSGEVVFYAEISER